MPADGPPVAPILWTLLAGCSLLVGLFFVEARAAVEVWNASTAYGHCYLVLPMTAYLLWDRREVFGTTTVHSEFGWSLLALPLAGLWLAAERLGIMEGRQLVAIAGFELFFLVVLGRRLFWQLSGPLLYLVFLVPFGAFLTPVLQRFTAIFSIIGLDLLAIPNFSDNFVIETPAGVFFVAEACAGLRFLIAAVAFGVFYALLNFRSPVRRAAFMAASVAVPVVANGFRALGIVVLGQILGSAEAAVADHIIYGWLFFSIVMLLLVAAGHPFRETSTVGAAPRVLMEPTERGRLFVGAVVTVGLLALGPGLAGLIDMRAVGTALTAMPTLRMPAGCAPASAEDQSEPASRRIMVRCDSSVFEVVMSLFPARSTASALVAERRRITQEVGAEDVTVAGLGDDGDWGEWSLVQTTDPNRVTALASWVDGAPVRSGMAGRMAQARDSLLGSDHAPVLMTITSAEPARVQSADRRRTLDRVRSLVQAQTGLNAQVAALSAIGAH
ncbi:MAG: exosortase [Pseudomonadota bacterium]|nr:exosortase [Pseudomonadota bacterium]